MSSCFDFCNFYDGFSSSSSRDDCSRVAPLEVLSVTVGWFVWSVDPVGGLALAGNFTVADWNNLAGVGVWLLGKLDGLGGAEGEGSNDSNNLEFHY